MEKASVSELKNALSAYLRKVRAGHVVYVYDRDELVAKLERVRSGRQEDRVAQLAAAGVLKAAREPFRASMVQEPVLRSPGALDALLDERADAR